MKEWEFETEFVDGEVVARITKLDFNLPRYSVQIGFLRRDRSITPFFSFAYNQTYDESFTLVNPVSYADRVAKLYAQAEAYILEKLEQRNNALRIEAENFAKEAAERKAKAEAKKKRHDANFERRRVENRQARNNAGKAKKS